MIHFVVVIPSPPLSSLLCNKVKQQQKLNSIFQWLIWELFHSFVLERNNPHHPNITTAVQVSRRLRNLTRNQNINVLLSQHERGPRKPKLQNLHSQMVHHHHHHQQHSNAHHLHGGFGNPLNNSSYSHHNHHATAAGVAAHFTQMQSSFQQHSAILHHPQPLNFSNLLHPTPLLPNSAGLSAHHASLAHKMHSSFDFPSLNSNFYKPLSHHLQQQLSPTNSKSTISVDSSSASSVSERMMSPHSTVDSQCGVARSNTPIIDPSSDTIVVGGNNSSHVKSSADEKVPISIFSSTSSTGGSSSVSSPPFTAAISTNGQNGHNHTTSTSSLLSQQTTMSGGPTAARASMQNGLLDILMSPDKYQELIQYHQAQNSIIFPSLHQAAYQIDALNPRLPTWEFLQVGNREQNAMHITHILLHCCCSLLS